MLAQVAREAAGGYLVVTLVATSLAKLRNGRQASRAVRRERVVPAGMAPLVIGGVAAAELGLATLMALGTEPAVTGSAVMVLFLLFAGYRVLAASRKARTDSYTCPCVGVPLTSEAAPRAVAAAVAACVIQAGLACGWGLAGRGGAGPVGVPLVVAWAVPFAVCSAGLVWQVRKRARGNRPPEGPGGAGHTVGAREPGLARSQA
jgi:hypothetical protein